MHMYDSLENTENERQNFVGFMPLFGFAQVVGLVSVIMLAFWLGQYSGGFSWSESSTIFNNHPLFMVLGLVIFYGDVLRSYPKGPVKLAHAMFNLGSLVFAIIGLSAVFESHDRNFLANMYSLHSWIGMLTVVIFALQWTVSFCVFLFPGGSDELRSRIMPYHRFIGIFLFVCSLAACASGISEKNVNSKVYAEKNLPEMLGNLVGILIMGYGGLIFYLATKPAYRRLDKSPSLQPIIRE